MPRIVVVGAGVSGLTSAYLLSKDKSNQITVVAKHMPGDYDIEYASPWAGANVFPMADEKNSRWERRTWPELRRLAAEVPEAGIHFQKTRVYRRKKDIEKLRQGGYTFDSLFDENPWYQTLFEDYRELGADELPGDMASGNEFGSVVINPMLYLPWLVGRCRANGVVLRRGTLRHVGEAAGLSSHGGGAGAAAAAADVVVNATGLMSCRLGGVMDGRLYPARGQVVVVGNEAPYALTKSGTDDGFDDEVCYMMTRASGGGTVLGGTYQKGQWESQPDPNTALRIMRRAVATAPELAGGRGLAGLQVVRQGVGLRPAREGGVRLEAERVGGVWVVHNYGHAGWGYQGSYGCAERVLELVAEVLDKPKL